MGTVIKRYCDICGKEIQGYYYDKRYLLVKRNQTITSNELCTDFSIEIMMCTDCNNKIHGKVENTFRDAFLDALRERINEQGS